MNDVIIDDEEIDEEGFGQDNKPRVVYEGVDDISRPSEGGQAVSVHVEDAGQLTGSKGRRLSENGPAKTTVPSSMPRLEADVARVSRDDMD